LKHKKGKIDAEVKAQIVDVTIETVEKPQNHNFGMCNLLIFLYVNYPKNQ